MEVTTEYGLTIRFPKIKLLVVGTATIDTDLAPLSIGSSIIESVPSFRYIEGHGGVALDLNNKIAGAPKVLEFLENLLSGQLLVR